MRKGPFEIPKKSDEELQTLVAKYQPLVRREGALRQVVLCNLRNESFIWDPICTEKAPSLTEVCRVPTLHTYGHPSLFKPSIADVLCQVPDGLEANFFEIVGPDDTGDLNTERAALNRGFHVATTIFYKEIR